MQIGQVSKLTGASPKAIRHYEVLGLLGSIPRAGAYRQYSEYDVRWIKLIKQAQLLGFTLSELLALERAGNEPNWPQLITMIEHKRANIAAEIARLRQLDERLDSIATEILGCGVGENEKASSALPDSCPRVSLS